MGKNKVIVITCGVEKEVSCSFIKGLDITIRGHNNVIKIEYPIIFENSKIQLDGQNNIITFKSSTIGYRNLEILCLANGKNKKISFGENCSCEGLSIFCHDTNSSLEIGNNVMIARDCCIQVSDSHSILDKHTHQLIDTHEHHISIGDNVWIAQGSMLLKNAKIAANSIVGTSSVVTKPFTQENIVIAGNPAKIIKKDIVWLRHSYNSVKEKHDVETIKPYDISFVVQGAVDGVWTKKTLTSIKQLFPGSFIILSTWEGQNTQDISYLCDEIIYNKDPGSLAFSQDKDIKSCFNLDRQIISTQNGLKAVKTKYAMKIRTDMIIKNTDFLDYFDKLNSFDDSYRLVEKRIISFPAYKSYTSDGKRSWDFCMHDYAYFGLTKDLLLVWDIPTMTHQEKHYWTNNKYPDITENMPDFFKTHINNKVSYQYHAEQYLCLKFFSKLKNICIDFKHMFDIRDENIGLFQKLFINNFVGLYADRLGISLPKDSDTYYNATYTSSLDFTWPEYLRLYNQYAQGQEKIPLKDTEKQQWTAGRTKKKTFRKKTFRLLSCFVPIKNWRKKIRNL